MRHEHVSVRARVSRRLRALHGMALAAAIAVGGCAGQGGQDAAPSAGSPKAAAGQGTRPAKAMVVTAPSVQAASPADAGRYLVLVGGCNDCHTPGFMEKGLDVPESQWLTGVPLGWKGPWGTTYASNLRLFARDFDENTWVAVLRARHARPPMPWSALNTMSEQDLKAVRAYLLALGPAGERTPPALPPGVQPKTPWLAMEPVFPPGMTPPPPAPPATKPAK